MAQNNHSASRRSRNRKKKERRQKKKTEVAETSQLKQELRVEHPDDRLLPGFAHV